MKGTVCDDLFDELSANTICKSMGFACSKSFKSVGDRRSLVWGDVSVHTLFGQTLFGRPILPPPFSIKLWLDTVKARHISSSAPFYSLT